MINTTRNSPSNALMTSNNTAIVLDVDEIEDQETSCSSKIAALVHW